MTDQPPAAERSIAERVISALSEQGSSVAVAESLTGGLICSWLVEVAGASVVLRGGVIAYATDLKHLLLGVDADLLARCGPVDPQVAAQMALGVRSRLAADWGVASTGVAGPGGQDGVPAGCAFVAVAGALRGPAGAEPGGAGIGAAVRQLALDGDRSRVRAGSAEAALNLLLASVRAAGTAAGPGGVDDSGAGPGPEHGRPAHR